MIDRFNRETAKAIKEKVLEQISIPGVIVQSNGGRFSEGEYTLKLKFTLESPAENVYTQEQDLYNQAAKLYRLKPLGETFTRNGETYKIVGWNNKARKYPVIGKRVLDGAMYKFPQQVVEL